MLNKESKHFFGVTLLYNLSAVFSQYRIKRMKQQIYVLLLQVWCVAVKNVIVNILATTLKQMNPLSQRFPNWARELVKVVAFTPFLTKTAM